MKKYTFHLTNFIIILSLLAAAGCSPVREIQKSPSVISNGINLDTVRAGAFDTGKMWTFEYAPVDYFSKEYNFTPSQEWFDHVRMSALKFATYCSASFVSEDGLVMTNDHCGRESVTDVSDSGESLQENGFYAETPDQERKVEGLFVEQLVRIEDVTSEIQTAIDNAPDQDKAIAEKKAISGIEKREWASSGFRTKVTKLYNGGKYSLYYYKRYNDVRLVFAPETQIGYFGGDPDNFTYPRYNLDCTFFRVYDDSGKPLKTEHYFKWSSNGALAGEPVFVVGNPGTTNRLSTVAQLEYMRDVLYPPRIEMYSGLINIYHGMLRNKPSNSEELTNDLLGYTNSLKAYNGMLEGLRNPVLMAKKKDFEKTFKSKVRENPGLNARYGDMWEKIENVKNQQKQTAEELYGLTLHSLTTPQYFEMAVDIINLIAELDSPEEQKTVLTASQLDSLVNSFYPEELDLQKQKLMLFEFVQKINKYLGTDYPLVNKITGGRKGMEAVDYILSNSDVVSREKAAALLQKGADGIINSNDPFIYFIINSEARRVELQNQSFQLSQEEKIYSQNLGRALFEVFGTSIPPDATFTLRISDGVVEGFPYNGTVAPPITTFYGLYDRYYSFNEEHPWNLPERWKNPPAEFELQTPFNFVSTNDIIGGNSGSPVINRKGEVVGLAFDGNIQSLPGSFIFTTEENRTVSVHSAGMIEAVKDLYHAKRLSEELKNGKITLK